MTKLIKVNIKDKAKVKASKVIIIKATKGIKSVTLNGKKVAANKFKNKTVKTYSLSLKKKAVKKLLKKKGKANKLVITDKNKNKRTITFTVK